MKRNNKLLFLSLSLFQLGVLICLFSSVVNGLWTFVIASFVYIIWLFIGKISPYYSSPYNHMPNWPIYRRGFRIKFATSALIVFLVILQLDIGFVALQKTWAGDVSFFWVAVSAAIGICIYLYRDLSANRKNYQPEEVVCDEKYKKNVE